MSKTVTLSAHRLVNSVQDIQRGYYNRLRTFLATASDEQIETIKKALGQADTLGVFAIEQEQAARAEGFLGFQVKETESLSAAADASGYTDEYIAEHDPEV